MASADRPIDFHRTAPLTEQINVHMFSETVVVRENYSSAQSLGRLGAEPPEE
jgi:hypothetical protein